MVRVVIIYGVQRIGFADELDVDLRERGVRDESRVLAFASGQMSFIEIETWKEKFRWEDQMLSMRPVNVRCLLRFSSRYQIDV